jgi:ABC-type Zn uptake system ZnuABC Zn-binding protein ZnuA
LLLCPLGFVGCTKAPDPWKDAKPGQKRILTTFPPLYSLTQAVVGDDAFVLCFLTTEGPHDYEFNPVDAVKAKGADLIISNGLTLDDEFVHKLKARLKVPAFSVGDALPESLLQAGDEHEKHDKNAKHDEDSHHHHGAHDPHVWLGPPQAMAMADAIAQKLAEIDPDHKKGYADRAGKLKDELAKLHEHGKAAFKDKKNKRVVTMHESFAYFAKAFGLEVADFIQPKANVAPDAGWLAQLEQRCRDKHVGAITYEPQYSKSQPAMLQKELQKKGLDVQLTEFDPLETAPLAKGSLNPDPSYYFTKMRENIDNLAKALP